MTIQDALRQLEDAGCFEKARGGDQAAANYFVRAAAFLANPTGDPNGWGWLSKSGGEGGVDADDGHRYAEDALVLGSHAGNLSNVYDFVGGTGAPGARVLYSASAGPRRASNVWVAPHRLSAREAAYIGLPGAGEVPIPPQQPQPRPEPPKPSKPPYAGDGTFVAMSALLEGDYREAGREGLDGGCGVWFGRVTYDYYVTGLSMPESIAKHRAEWRAALGL